MMSEQEEWFLNIQQYIKLLSIIEDKRDSINSTELARKFSMSYPIVCTKTRFLEKIGMVNIERKGRDNMVNITSKGKTATAAYYRFTEAIKLNNL